MEPEIRRLQVRLFQCMYKKTVYGLLKADS